MTSSLPSASSLNVRREGQLQGSSSDLDRCPRTGGACRTPVACHHWGCQAQDAALAEGLRGVRVALDLCGLGKR
jgi:hypothetical protein